jgi:hypothetical protein
MIYIAQNTTNTHAYTCVIDARRATDHRPNDQTCSANAEFVRVATTRTEV